MFSSRFDWQLCPNKLSLLLADKRQKNEPILDLTESNPTRAGLEYPVKEILAALSNPASLVYEPAPMGLSSAREAVCEYYAKRGESVEKDRVMITASTSEAYSFLFKLLADPGDEVLVPQPSYPLFDYLAAADSVRVAPYPLVYHGVWSIDFDALEHSLTPRTRAIILVNPNNPTGSFLKRSELQTLVRICQEHGLAIISDEVFSDFGFDTDSERVPTLAGVKDVLSFSLSGLSKIAGLPQMKAGWIVISGPGDLRMIAAERLELIADTYLSVGAPVQHALPRLLEIGESIRDQIVKRTRANFDFLCTETGGNSPSHPLHLEGGWYATLRVPNTQTEEALCMSLLQHDGVLVQPGFFYDFHAGAYLVLSLLTESTIFREGLQRLLARIRSI